MRKKKMALHQSTASIEPNASLRQWWSVITILLLAAIFLEAVLAGAMLSGVDWARTAHRVNAAILIASTLAAGLVAVITLRRVAHGPRLGLTLLSLAAVVFLQAALGALSAKGANLLWVHVPLGVALFGFAARAADRARRLGGE
jgi:heme A synthase